ncbi:30S ribosomal protein S11 [archaeon]|jgi:small subunit ribosomal protein S11|nr:30S ribosomal protein S11 [archaeon]MBT4242051.1 30S ribosomal protein S11 [archaeon]MBT4417739.1 30S ribosomal protein S11 [archaeon]
MVEEKTQIEEIEEAQKKKAESISKSADLEDSKNASEDSKSASEDKGISESKGDVKEEINKGDSESKEAPKKKREDRIAILNIYTTFNNTIMNLTDLSGATIAKFRGGQSTKQDRLKANPTIAMFMAQKISETARDNGITGFYVKIRASTGQNNPGPGAHAAIKSLTRSGFKILSIMDTTKIARGGPKKKGGRRGRRV